MALAPQMVRFVLICLLSISVITAPSMASSLDLCPLCENETIANSPLTWAQVLGEPILHFDQSSYIRPDIGTSRCSTRGEP